MARHLAISAIFPKMLWVSPKWWTGSPYAHLLILHMLGYIEKLVRFSFRNGEQL
jgi:hypothetical protein